MKRAVFAALLAACTAAPTDLDTGEVEGPTWWQDAKPVVDARCAGCHQAGDIGPFPLTTYAEARSQAAKIRVEVEAGTMPPWPPGPDCSAYEGERSLPENEKATLLAWLDAGTPEGDPSSPGAPIDVPLDDFVADVVVELPEPYLPVLTPDDYRCQIVDWPLAASTHIVGFRVQPDQRQMVHHAIVFVAPPEKVGTFQELDAAEQGPGYTCFGGPSAKSAEEYSNPDATLADVIGDPGEFGLGELQWVGAWVPGSAGGWFPEGTGIAIEPGSVLIVQMHYNTSTAEAVADQSTIELATATTVEREAMILPFTDLGWVTGSDELGGPMLIPAGDAAVVHETSTEGDGLVPLYARLTLGLPLDAPLVIHSVGHHMHQRGTRGHQELRTATDTQCLLDIPEWDFHWQGTYALVEPALLHPEDELVLTCEWDNSLENQPMVDGVYPAPQDLLWGEGTSDEMCLSAMYVTGP